MSENLFSFQSEANSPEGSDPFDASVFGDLGSEEVAADPFTDMLLAQSSEREQSAAGPEAAAAASPAPAPERETEPKLEQPAPVSQPASAPTQPKTPLAPPTEGDNPLLAAIELAEEKNAQKAAEPIFAQLPVFSYNGNTEPIEDIKQTFEELRIAKIDDFPEFEDAQSVSWTVTYGKVSKSVPIPRKAKIGDFKREIETSKPFMEALKKAADKKPKCVITPRVTMQKKGLAAQGYKAAFTTLTEARRSNKTICFIPAKDGRVYERRVNAIGEFITPASSVSILDEIKASFHSELPRIPYALMRQILAFFRAMMARGGACCPLEALVNIYWDREEERYIVHVPRQKVGKEFVEATVENEDLLFSDRYIHYADIHSHNDMRAKFSVIDDHDEQANRVYIVVGRLDRQYYPEVVARVCNGGHFLYISPERVIEEPPAAEFPTAWLDSVYQTEETPCEAAA